MWWWWLMACRTPVVAAFSTDVAVTSEAGAVRLDVPVADSTSLLLGLSGDGFLGVDRVVGPSGEVLDFADWLGEEQLTTAVFANEQQVVLNWPVLEGDAPLEPGTWFIEVAVLDAALEPADGVELRGVLMEKADARLTRGEHRALVVIPEDLDEALASAVPPAVEGWVELWDRVGVAVEVEIIDADVPTTVPDLFVGDPQVEVVGALAEGHDVVVWIAEDLALPNALGDAGSVPNAAFGGPRGVVGVSVLQAAGADGVFDEAEARLLGEVLAHEAAHHAGVFHPIETNWTTRDALDDTEVCADRTACENALGGNLMFPYPVCLDGFCYPAERLTDEQAGVLHRYTGVR